MKRWQSPERKAEATQSGEVVSVHCPQHSGAVSHPNVRNGAASSDVWFLNEQWPLGGGVGALQDETCGCGQWVYGTTGSS